MAQPAPNGTSRPALTYHDNDADDASAEDVLDQILENYNFICHPEIRLKFKHELQQFALGVAVAKPWHHRPRLRLTFKPLLDVSPMAKVIQKVLLVPTHAQACVFSRKLSLGWLRLQFMGGYNWARRRPTLDYRVTTKWSDGARIKRKEQYSVGDGLLLRAKWNMDLHLPDVEGHVGADDLELDPIDVDFGRLDFEISQVDVVLSPFQWRASAQRRAAAVDAESCSEGALPLPALPSTSAMLKRGAVGVAGSGGSGAAAGTSSTGVGGQADAGGRGVGGPPLDTSKSSNGGKQGGIGGGIGRVGTGAGGAGEGSGLSKRFGGWLKGWLPGQHKVDSA